jgi:hypothetical protein
MFGRILKKREFAKIEIGSKKNSLPLRLYFFLANLCIVWRLSLGCSPFPCVRTYYDKQSIPGNVVFEFASYDRGWPTIEPNKVKLLHLLL